MNDTPLHILFSGGVTGGHLFPGLAIAEQLLAQSPGGRITFAGAGGPLDRRQVHKAGHEYLGIPCHATPRRLSEIGQFLSKNRRGAERARHFIREEQVDVVIGLGGYASFPAARAAKRCKVPLVLIEQNVYPGRATRWLARSADLILASFAATKQHLRTHCDVSAVGNPVRSAFLAETTPPDSTATTKNLLILGGSNGAGELNEQVPKALYRLRQQLAGWSVTHQSGTRQHAETQLLYSKLDLPVRVIPFVDNMARALADADLAISRAGGTALAELAATHVPAILCPLAAATDDHQRRNADHFASHDAAIVMPKLNTSSTNSNTRFDAALADALLPLLTDDANRQALSSGMAQLARPHAAMHAAQRILRLLLPTNPIPAPLGLSVPNPVEARL